MTVVRVPLVAALAVASLAAAGHADEDVLVAADGKPGDALGLTVAAPYSMVGGPCLALQGDTIAVGADHVGPQPNHGSVTVFRRSGSYWAEAQELTFATGGEFGRAVALDGGFLVVGAPDDSFGAVPSTGSVSSFRWNGSAWVHEARLFASTPTTNGFFGNVVAVDGDVLAVTSRIGTFLSTLTSPGRVTVFRRSSGTWNLEQELDGGGPGKMFGMALAIDGDRLAIGVPGENGGKGSVYLYLWDGSGWSQESRLTWPGLGGTSYLGTSVAFRGDVVVAGAPGIGRAYTFRRSHGTWGTEQELGVGVVGGAFGSSVALDGDRLAVGDGATTVRTFDWDGAHWLESDVLTASYPAKAFGNAVALDGPVLAVAAPDTDVVGGEEDQGAVLVYDDREHGWVDEGGGKAGLLATPPVLVGLGDLTPSTLNRVTLSNVTPLSLAAAFLSTTSVPVPFEGGTLLAHPWVGVLSFTTGATVDVTYKMPAGAVAGTEIWVQFAVAEDAGLPGLQAVALSNAIRGTVP